MAPPDGTAPEGGREGCGDAGARSRWAPAAFGLVVLLSLYVLFSQGQGGPSLFDGADKLVHTGLFALLTGTARWAFGRRPAHLLLLAAYAALSEVVQAVALPRRSGDWLDVVADLTGIVLVAVVAPVLARRR